MRRISMIIVVLFSLGLCFILVSNSFSTSVKGKRFQGEVELGMTREQVLESWGEPDKIVKKKGKDYDEIWIYIPHWKIKNYLYFKDGILKRGVR